jgi:hypothetical protein
MRDPNRLDAFYDKLKEIHKTNFPDWRFGQLMSNFFYWYYGKTGLDIFYTEDSDIRLLFDDFVNAMMGG